MFDIIIIHRPPPPHPLAGIKPMTFQLLIGQSHHWAMGDSHGEEGTGLDENE